MAKEWFCGRCQISFPRICSSKRNRDQSCAAKVIAIVSWARISLSCCAAETVPTSLSVKKRIVIPSYILSVLLVFARRSAAVFVYDQPVAEAIFAHQMTSDQSKLCGYGLVLELLYFRAVKRLAFDAALEGGGIETDCTSDAAYVYIRMRRCGASYLFILELNFHSGSSITQVRLTSMSDCCQTGALGVLFLTFHGMCGVLGKYPETMEV
ncbi:hypothetical protein IGI04_014811 [Brassica rapa subsp. trilocularis]|uniref:Uncharacterized protein n=1 Tax=Brassica rapa subsp. trilocularis TaxID=1813537 RepID=A0ABQ7MN93_BRACM|nr:hypothetical protein IGI04_014811 [Brassica rapa subsp. trilocularis]